MTSKEPVFMSNNAGKTNLETFKAPSLVSVTIFSWEWAWKAYKRPWKDLQIWDWKSVRSPRAVRPLHLMVKTSLKASQSSGKLGFFGPVWSFCVFLFSHKKTISSVLTEHCRSQEMKVHFLILRLDTFFCGFCPLEPSEKHRWTLRILITRALKF